jgi:hypothetical protein
MIIEQPTTQRPASQPATTSTLDRWRLPVIGVVVVLAVAIGAVLGSALIARGGAALGRAADYVPGDTVMYVEARFDLPGAQRDNLRALLERFPSADADAILTDALAATLDDALAGGGTPFDYSTDIAPWFDGSVAIALLDYPMSMDPTQVEVPSLLALFGVRDPAAASALADEVRATLEDDGLTFTSSDHDGTTIWALDIDADLMGSVAGAGFAYAVTGDQLILGSGQAELARALDTETGGDTLAGRDDVSQLLGSLPDERVGLMVVNSAAMLAEMRAELETVQPGMAELLAPYLDATPAIAVGSVELAADAVLFDTASDLGGGPVTPANGSRTLAEAVPADAIFYADATSVGASLEAFVAAMKASIASLPDGDQMLEQLDQAESALGANLEELVSWIGAGAVTAGWDGQEAYVGMVLDATDPAAAERRLSQLRSFAELAALDPGSGITVETEAVAGVDMTTVRMAANGAPAFGTPFAPALQYAIDGDRVLIGLGDTFVRDALVREAADSLAQSERFTAAVSRFGGQDNAAAMFVDLTGLRLAAESVMGADPSYQDVKPELEPFDYLASVSRVSGGRIVAKAGLVLR